MPADDPRRILIRHDESVSAVALNAAGQVASGGGWDKTVRFHGPGWAMPADDPNRILILHEGPVEAVDLNSASEVAFGGRDQTIRFHIPGWKIPADEPTPINIRFRESIIQEAENSAGQVASFDHDNIVALGNPQTNKIDPRLNFESIREVHLDDNGVIQFSGLGVVDSWRIRLVTGFPPPLPITSPDRP